MLNKTVLQSSRDEINAYLVNKLLPFWFDRSKDQESGGLITHFDRHGNDSGENEKSLIAQTRMLYSFSNVFRSGYGSMCKEFAEHGLDFLVNRMWEINYHSIRAMIQSKEKLDALLDKTDRT